MLGAFKNLWNSEKAVAVGVLIVAATILVATGKMSVVEWTDYTKWLITVYVGGKTAQGLAEAWTSRGATHETSEVTQKLIEVAKPEATSVPMPLPLPPPPPTYTGGPPA